MLSNARSRSISAENFTGAKGAGAVCEPEDGIGAYKDSLKVI
jgi:hypothetical protein